MKFASSCSRVSRIVVPDRGVGGRLPDSAVEPHYWNSGWSPTVVADPRNLKNIEDHSDCDSSFE